jgi:hypothetical protein
MLSADVFFGPMLTAIQDDPYTPFTAKADVVLAELGDDVCLLGAAALGFDAL